MKLVLISDTHERHRKITVPDGDVLIHAGDFTLDGHPRWVEDFNDWLGSLPHAHKVVIAGNHEMNWNEQKKALLTNCTYLEDSGCEINGLKFYGSPFTPVFGHWAFMLPRSGNSLLQKWLQIPEGTDVLITHGPPKNILDREPHHGQSVGDFDLGLVVKALEPRLHVFGHIHGGYGVFRGERTTYVNAASVDEAYQPVNAPVVVEL